MNVPTGCLKCDDVGVLRVKDDEQGFDSLVYCTCDWAKQTVQPWRFPRLTTKIESAFTVTKCPLAWFLPDNERGSVPVGSMNNSVAQKISEWNKRAKDAEEFWKQWLPVFEDKKPRHHMEDL